MKSKRCTNCDSEYPIGEFNKSSSWCKPCKLIGVKKYQKTKRGVVCKMYSMQRSMSKKRGHPMPSYTLDELVDFCLNNITFKHLYNVWVNSGYESKIKPSIDRIDDYKPYTLENLQVVTWKENNRRYHMDAINGINTKQCISVLQKLNGKIVNSFYSINQAERETGVWHTNISKACSGERNSAGGYEWEVC